MLYNLVFVLSLTTLVAQPTKEWNKTFGGSSNDEFSSLQQTRDGGYILGGTSYSPISGDKTDNFQGNSDYWIVKLDAAGNKQWDRAFGGSDYDKLQAVQQTEDGGYILGGYSSSGIGGDKTQASRGNNDYWVVKLDASGNKQWAQTFGGDGNDLFSELQQTKDGGYLLGGESDSDMSGDKTAASRGSYDFWVVKLDAAGNRQWDHTFGGSKLDGLGTLQQTEDGGYILGGASLSGVSGDKTEPQRIACEEECTFDMWVVKIDADGNKQWDKTIGGTGGESGEGVGAILQTIDSGYLLGGASDSHISGDKTAPNKGARDFWIVKIDGNGNKEWDKTFGGREDDALGALQKTSDGGYILGGTSSSGISGDKTEANRGFNGYENDYWLVKLDANGEKQWDKTIGGGDEDIFQSLQQTQDGGFILGGYSDSPISGDKTEASRGNVDWGYIDYWVVKLKAETQNNCTFALTTKITQAEPWYGMWGPKNGAGAIDLTVTDGTPPYIYQWNAGVSSEDLPTAVPGGFYSVVVTDANGCTGTTTTFVGKKNDFLRVISSHSNVSIPGGSDGAIDLTVIGGVVPATYQWSNGATTEDLTGLAAGTYKVIVTDAFGRKSTTTVIISEPDTPLSVSIAHQNVTAPGKEDGAIDVTVVGGVGPYTYRWNTGARTEDLHYALPGLYTVTVTSAMEETATASVQVTVGRDMYVAMGKGAAGEEKLAPTTACLTAYPNPATERAKANFSLPAPGKYTLELYDVRGAKVKTLAAGQAQANNAMEVEMNVADYAKGIYLLKLVTDKGVSSQRLMIGR